MVEERALSPAELELASAEPLTLDLGFEGDLVIWSGDRVLIALSPGQTMQLAAYFGAVPDGGGH